MHAPRRALRTALAFLLALACARGAAAQTGTWSDEFDRPGLLGRVFAVAEYGGELVAGGLGVEADGQEFGNVARYDGHRWRPLGAGIHGFVVEDFAVFQGELVAAGSFTLAGGTIVKSIARWDGAQWRPLGGGIGLSFANEGLVFALAVHQGQLFAAGAFDRAGNLPVANIARWDGVQWSAVGSGIDGDVYALLAGGDGMLYAAGSFGHAGGASVANVARWDGAAWSPVGAGIGAAGISQVRALEWHAGRLWAGGSFDVPGGDTHEKLASFANGAWTAEGNFPDSAIGTSIYALQSSGSDLYVGGSIVSVDGVDVDRIARLAGAQWTSIGGVRGLGQTTVVLALGTWAGELAVGGNFTHAGLTFDLGAPVVSNSIAGFDGAQWRQIGKGLGFDGGVRGGLTWNGGLVAVGGFLEAGRSIAPSVAFFDGVDWAPLGAFDGPAHDATTFQNELVVAGAFTSVDGQPMPGVAAFDGTAWHGFGPGGFGNGYGAQAVAVYNGELYAGTLGGVQRWNGSSWESFAPQIFGSVHELQPHGGVLYIAGMFTQLGGHVAAWDGVNQQIVAGGMNDAVDVLASFGPHLLAGGAFTQAGGVPARRLARWDGAAWSEFPGVTGESVTSLAVLGGELYAGGNPLLANPPLEYVARWEGAQWQPLGGGIDGPAFGLIADAAAGRLYAGGLIHEADGRPSLNFAAWSPPSAAGGVAYCAAGTTTNGCTPGIAGQGDPSASLPAGFSLLVTGVEGNKLGLILYGVDGRNALPWGSGTSTLCVQPPLQRLPPQLSGGITGFCNGMLAVDWNAWRQSHPNALGAPFAPGQSVWAQAWFRDPPAPTGTNLSNALEFVLQP